MFILKFVNGDTQHVIQSPSYIKDKTNTGYLIVPCDENLNETGEVFHIATRDKHTKGYGVCYIENEAGRTIDRITAENSSNVS